MRKQLQETCLILIIGVAGSGKTTLAKEILRRLAAVYLDNNHIVDAFFPHVRHGHAYEKLRLRFYEALYRIAEENLKMGNSVILDAPHVKEIQIPRWRDFVRRLAARSQCKIIVIRCLCSEKTLHARLRSRAEKRDAWKLTHWKEFLREQPVEVSVAWPHLDIDTERCLASNAKAAMRHILKGSHEPPQNLE